MDPRDKEPLALLGAWLVLAALSAIRPHAGYGIWFLEVLPALLALALLVPTHRRFRFTPLVYRLLFVHACVLTLGAHYSYAEVPPGHWVKEALDLQRNHYDRVGHFVQGFVPALVAREVLLRRSPLAPGKWTFFLVTCVCVAFSALYEMIEWWTAVLGGEQAAAFLGTQGDPWDTQWDMFLCMSGAILGQLALGGVHQRQLDAVHRGSG